MVPHKYYTLRIIKVFTGNAKVWLGLVRPYAVLDPTFEWFG